MTMPSVVLAISSACRISTTKRMPLMPAMAVRSMLSEMICERMLRGVAPIARRMPISVVRSRTVTIMMFDTPMAPASSVPMPTSQMSMLTPRNMLSTIENIISVLNIITPLSSFGLTSCACAITLRIRSVMSLIFTPGFPVMQSKSMLCPRLYTCCTSVMGSTTACSSLPLMFMLPSL